MTVETGGQCIRADAGCMHHLFVCPVHKVPLDFLISNGHFGHGAKLPRAAS